MDFKQLRSFVAVIRYGSFTTAASKLRVSQPTVSTHIRQLEEELGMPLVLRNAKRVELTAAGYKMFDQAAAMLAMHDKMLQTMRRRERETIYLGASLMPSAYILPELLAEFAKQESDARFVITQDSSRTVLNGMLSGLYEFGFIGFDAHEDTLECIPLCKDKIVLVTANDPKFRGIDASDPEALASILKSERIIVRKAGSATREVGNRILAKLGMEESDLDVLAHLEDQESTRNLVEFGLGVALMSETAVRNRVANGRMLAFDIPDFAATRSYYLLRRKNVPLGVLSEKLFALALKWGKDKI